MNITHISFELILHSMENASVINFHLLFISLSFFLGFHLFLHLDHHWHQAAEIKLALPFWDWYVFYLQWVNGWLKLWICIELYMEKEELKSKKILEDSFLCYHLLIDWIWHWKFQLFMCFFLGLLVWPFLPDCKN